MEVPDHSAGLVLSLATLIATIPNSSAKAVGQPLHGHAAGHRFLEGLSVHPFQLRNLELEHLGLDP